MAQRGQPERCVFCGNPIAPDELAVGHGESAAHVSCADAALGDERLWEGIASAVGDDGPVSGDDGQASRDHPPVPGDGGPASPPGQGPPAAGRSGCAVLAALLLLLAAAAPTARRLRP